MKIHLVKRQSIEDFISRQARSRSSFYDWLGKCKAVDWKCPDDIRATFSTADFLGNGSSRVVFDIGGNNYRMICKCVFGATYVRLYICWIGTHAENTHLCKRGMQYSINQF